MYKIALKVIIIVLLGLSSCKSKSSAEPRKVAELLIQVESDNSITLLEEEFKAYELKMEKVVSRPTKIYLFSYKNEYISEAAIIQQLKLSKEVQEAQPNRKVELRN